MCGRWIGFNRNGNEVISEEWRWEVDGSKVKILSPTNRYWSLYAGCVAYPSIYPVGCEEVQHDFKGSVLPSEVKNYIEMNLIKAPIPQLDNGTDF